MEPSVVRQQHKKQRKEISTTEIYLLSKDEWDVIISFIGSTKDLLNFALASKPCKEIMDTHAMSITPFVLEEPWTLNKALLQPHCVIEPNTISKHLQLLETHQTLATKFFEVREIQLEDLLKLVSATSFSEEPKKVQVVTISPPAQVYEVADMQQVPLGFAISTLCASKLLNATEQAVFKLLSSLQQVSTVKIDLHQPASSTISSVVQLPVMTKLKHITLSNSSEAVVAALISCSPALNTLCCWSCAITASTLQKLANCPHLTSLDLFFTEVTTLTDQDILQSLEVLPNIKKLSLKGKIDITGSCLQTIHIYAPQLESLSINRHWEQTSTSQQQELYIGGLMPQLRVLDLDFGTVSPKMKSAFEHFLPKIEKVDFSIFETDWMMEVMAEHCPMLQSIYVRGILSPKMLQQLSEKKHLRKVRVSSLSKLEDLLPYCWKGVRSLTVHGKSYPECFTTLVKAFPSLKRLTLHTAPKNLHLLETVLNDTTNWPALKSLYIGGNTFDGRQEAVNLTSKLLDLQTDLLGFHIPLW